MSRLSDTEEQIPLSEQFSHPLSLVSELTVESANDVEELFVDLENRISQNDDWQKRSSAIQEVISYIKGGIQNYPDANFASLAPGIASSVTNLRSALVRWGSLYVAAASQVLQVNFVSSMEIIVPALFKQLSHGTAVISNSCRFALLEVARNVPHRRTSRAFLAKLKSKSNPQRQVVAEFIQIAVEGWPNSLIASLNTTFSDALKALVEDPSPSVRQVARETAEAFGVERPSSRSNSRAGLAVKIPSTPATPRSHISHIPTSPSSKARTPSFKRRSVDESPEKGLRTSQIPLSPKFGDLSSPRSPSKSGPMTQPIKKSHSLLDSHSDDSSPLRNPLKFAKIPPPIDDKLLPTKDIDEYMPPKTHKDSEKFLKLLIEITSSQDYSRLDGLDVLLPPSIVSAVKFLPDIKHWQSVLPILFAQFPEAFDDQILDLIKAFNFSPWLVKQFFSQSSALDVHGALEKEAMNISIDSLHFFAAVFRQQQDSHEFDDLGLNSQKLKKKVLKIVSHFPEEPDSKFLKEKITGKPPSEKSTPVKSSEKTIQTPKSSEKAMKATKPTEVDLISQLSTTLEQKEGYDEILEKILNKIIERDDSETATPKKKQKQKQQQLLQGEDSDDSFIESKLEPFLLQFLNQTTSENRDQAVTLLEFCLQVLQQKTRNKFRSSSSKSCFSANFFNQLNELSQTEADRTIVELSSDVMVKMAEVDSGLIISLMQNVEDAMNNACDETALATLGIIHAFFKDLSEQQMGDFAEPVMQFLQPALASNNTSVRRIVVLIFVEFRYKIPQKFHQYMEQLSMTQQKLIELYSSKRGPKK